MKEDLRLIDDKGRGRTTSNAPSLSRTFLPAATVHLQGAAIKKDPTKAAISLKRLKSCK